MKIGNEDAKLYLGGSEVDKIYLGTEQVYGGSTATPKWIATYEGGTTSSAECDSTSAITEGEITLTNLTDVVIGDCVTGIGEYAFIGCRSLTSITIPDSVTHINESAFADCSSLTSVTIGSGVTDIGDYAFFVCLNLTSVTCLSTVPPSLGRDAFDQTNDCPIYVPSESVASYQSASGWSTYASRIQAIPSPSFSGKWIATYDGGTTESAECDSTSAITEGEITLTNLTDVVIGDCVTSIGNQAFNDCEGLTSVTIPNSVTSIGNDAFDECTSLTSVTIPNSVTSIGDCAFAECSSLTSVTIGSGVTDISELAFIGCRSLISITCLSTTPATLGLNAFDDTNNCPIYVPSGSVETYKTTSGWSTYASRIQAIA